MNKELTQETIVQEQSAQILGLLAELLNCKPCQDADGTTYLEEQIAVPFGFGKIWRYRVEGQTVHVTEKDGKELGSGTFQELLWTRLGLDRVCRKYREDYEQWVADNNDVPFLSTLVERDDGQKWEKPYAFMDYFLKGKNCERDNDAEGEEPVACENGLHLLMAEFGMGKTSFCYGIRKRVAEMVGEADFAIQASFLSGETTFPFLFNLNEYKDQDFDRFIQSKLYEDYGISLRYQTFERLCRAGLFSLVLDAWDQMHGTPRQEETIRDISQFASLWKNRGRVLITCRRSFYQTQLHEKRGGFFGRKSMEQASLYTLYGFSRKTAQHYLNYIYNLAPAKILCPGDWFDEAWRMNREFFIRPLNIQLLAKHYDAFRKLHDPEADHFDTQALLEVVLADWRDGLVEKEIKPWKPQQVLKQLTMLTLKSGLNRGVRIVALAEAIEKAAGTEVAETTEAGAEKLRGLLDTFEFVRIQPDRTEKTNDMVEFRLAAYQEFLWANLAVQELRGKELCNREDTLLGRFLMNPETRVWAAGAFRQEESDALAVQLSLLAYKNAAQTGFSGGNALTLLGDLNRISFYRNQLRTVRLTDRPLDGADLHGLNLSGLAFRRSSLRGANFSYTILEGTDFSGADLFEARWDEYGKLQHCAFIDPNPEDGGQAQAKHTEDLRVVSGTEDGGVLTYNVTTKLKIMAKLAQDEIRDIAADSKGVYTAGTDGYVGYLDPKGYMKNAYIASSGLQSITSGAPGAIYVGADPDGLTRYDWRRGSLQRIAVKDQNGKEKTVSTVYDIHYWSKGKGRQKKQCIAYTAKGRKELALLNLESRDQATELWHGTLRGDLTFSDICFAGEYLIYAVPGRGVFFIKHQDYWDEIEENNLLAPEKQLCALKGTAPVELAWSKGSNQILAVVKKEERVDSLLTIPFDEELAGIGNSTTVELDWLFGTRNYVVEGSQINGFCVTEDGKHVALAGARLAVFTLEDDDFYSLVQPPIEAKIQCEGANFQGCEGVPDATLNRFRQGGAKA